ncbi:MAG: type II secretion system F family protein [Lachnospiraceae bacterium]|nr:type II secretion system F family protein [Lachnospiraceae bacterium]
MAQFQYTAIAPDGKKKSGKVEAKSKEVAVANLKAEGYTVTKIDTAGVLNISNLLNFGKKVKKRDFAIFCRQFVSIVQAGVSIVDAFAMLAEQTQNAALKGAIEQTHSDISKGDTLAAAMRKRGGVFPQMLCNMVEAGEASGSLDKAFDRMAIQFEKDARLESAVKKAMIYPIVLIVVMIGVICAMMLFVIPRFTGMFEEIGAGELPPITKALVAISDFFVHYWWLIAIVVIAIVVGYKTFYATQNGKELIDRIKLRIPVFGQIQIKSACAKLGRTLCTLLGAGVPMVDALDITARSMDNEMYKQAMKDAKDQVTRGVTLSRPLKTCGLFPPMIIHMISIGEETGNIESMLENVAEYYEDDVQTATESMMALMEPAIVIVMAGLVGFLVLAILTPMFSLYESLS